MMRYMPTETLTSALLPSTQAVLAALKPGQRHVQPRPPGSGDAWLLADLARASRQTIVVLCSDPLSAQRLAEEVLLFAPDLRVRTLHDWATLPYARFSPHHDLIPKPPQ